MTVEKANEQYCQLQTEAKEIAAAIKPYVSRFRKLAKKAQSLGYKIDNDSTLYDSTSDDNNPKGWNTFCIFRLQDFKLADLDDCLILCENLIKTKFLTKKRK